MSLVSHIDRRRLWWKYGCKEEVVPAQNFSKIEKCNPYQLFKLLLCHSDFKFFLHLQSLVRAKNRETRKKPNNVKWVPSPKGEH